MMNEMMIGMPLMMIGGVILLLLLVGGAAYLGAKAAKS
jgi:hypothetical protein